MGRRRRALFRGAAATGCRGSVPSHITALYQTRLANKARLPDKPGSHQGPAKRVDDRIHGIVECELIVEFRQLCGYDGAAIVIRPDDDLDLKSEFCELLLPWGRGHQ
jgi:hypothetical protein